MAAEMATGVPKPAAPSRKAPKQKAMRIAWMRRSPETEATESFTVLKVLVEEVMVYRSIAEKTIHPIGNSP